MISVPPHLRSIVDHDGAVILDTPNNAMTPLNSTGAYVWERLERGMALDDIITELAQATSTDRTIVGTDVNLFMEELKSRRLVAVSP
jgi:hypothetical protein